jgi:predicted ArsR family transcriptional regulator
MTPATQWLNQTPVYLAAYAAAKASRSGVDRKREIIEFLDERGPAMQSEIAARLAMPLNSAKNSLLTLMLKAEVRRYKLAAGQPYTYALPEVVQ